MHRESEDIKKAAHNIQESRKAIDEKKRMYANKVPPSYDFH